MSLTKEEVNKEAISTFLAWNAITPETAMGFNKFEVAYHVGDSRVFREMTPVIFHIHTPSAINVILPEINDIEFETQFKLSQEDFHFDDDNETLVITSYKSEKHDQNYKILIHSLYLD
ncbi:hypothetical protein JHD47_00575 [Sulfurimonas sp. SAG-AH-194-L11]|nr:hypothetical protein [Sulfurimonas sp. SAG-AH-194-L11]MDF1876308.1 hypothetical protein [Sulfurimonas sp. SAG-AH-194-L11]